MRLVLQFLDALSMRAAVETVRADRGLLIDVEALDHPPNQAIEIALVAPGVAVTVDGVVIQSLGAHGLAIGFDPDDRRFAVLELVDEGPTPTPPAARWEEAEDDESETSDGDDDGDDGEDDEDNHADDDEDNHADDDEDDHDRGSARQRLPRAADIPLRERLKTATKAEKIQLALHGSRAERNLLIRDRDKLLHQYVIRNPKIGLDEVAAIAKMTTVAPDVLAHIAGKREWFQRPDIAAGLVRNPKVSPVVAKKLLNFVSAQELRQLAKGAGVREVVAQEARRRLFRRR